MRIAIELIEVLKRNDAADAESGRPRVNFTNIVHKKMDWRYGAKNVQIKPATGLASGGWL